MPIYVQGPTVTGSNTGDQIAATVPNTPAGNIAATNVQAAINELDTEKQPLRSELTSYAVHGADIASAATVNLDNATGVIVDITGTTDITAFTLAEGRMRLVRFTGATTLTPSASLLLPGGKKIFTAANDYAVIVAVAASTVQVISYFRQSGGVIAPNIVSNSGTTYTILARDLGNILKLGNASGVACTLPKNASATTAAIPTGTSIIVHNDNTGNITYSSEDGTDTIIGPTVQPQNYTAILLRYSSTSWKISFIPNYAALTASQVVVTDANKNLASLAYGTTATASTLVQRDANGTIVPKTPNDQTGTTYTFVITDAERTVTANNAAASTYTIPLASSVAFTVGTRIKLINKGVGAVGTVKTGSDTLIGNSTTNQNATSYIEKIAESAGVSTWHIFAGTATVAEAINGSTVGTLVNQAYDISVRMPFGGTITGITTKSTTTAVAGTFTVAISGTNVTGLTTVANGASGVRTNTSATAANTFVAGDYITITLAGATITDLFWSLAYTRAY